MGLEEKIGFMSNLNKKIRNSITAKIITYSLAGMLTLGCSSFLKQKEKPVIDDKIEISKLAECWNKTYRKGGYSNVGLDISIDKKGQLYTIGFYSTEDDDAQLILLKYSNNGDLLKEFPLWKEKDVLDKNFKIIINDKEDIEIDMVDENQRKHIKYDKEGVKLSEQLYKQNNKEDEGHIVYDKNNNKYTISYDNGKIDISKHDDKNNLIWEKTYITNNDYGLNNVVIDSNKNLYVLMQYSDNLIKYGMNGNKLQNLGLPIKGNHVIIDDKDNIYITGETKGGNHPDLAIIKLCNTTEDLSVIADCHNKCEDIKDDCNKECTIENYDFNKCDGSVNIMGNTIADCLLSCQINCSNIEDECKGDCGSAKELEIIDDRYQGLEAKIIIEEFADFECPFSEETEPILKQIKTEFTRDGIQIKYKHFPLEFHKSAFKAAEASECARDQGKFWEYHKILFENQDALNINDLKQYASNLSLNTKQFNECLDIGIKGYIVEKDIEEGKTKDISAVPTFFINDTFIEGVQPFERFYEIIDRHLGGPRARLVWTVTYNGGGDDYGNDIAIDDSGYVYVVGHTEQVLAENENHRTLEFNGVILKYNKDGNLVWEKVSDIDHDSEPTKILLDKSNNIYVTGWTYGDKKDIFVTKFNKKGNMEWNRLYDSRKDDEPTRMFIDESNNLNVIGTNDRSEYIENIILKYDKNGNILENKITEEIPDDTDLIIDNLGYEYIVKGDHTRERNNILIVKEIEGREVWEKSFDSGHDDLANAIKLDKFGNIYVVGYFYSTATDRDMLILKYQQPEIEE